jgi:Ca2+-binding RTX toxin-like protein
MYGLDGKEILIGEAGIDGLVGGRGSDFLAGGSEADGFYFNDETIVAGEYDQVGDFQDGLDFVYLPTSAAGYTLTDTGLGALLSMNLGGSTWGVYFTGFTVSQLADQIIFA